MSITVLANYWCNYCMPKKGLGTEYTVKSEKVLLGKNFAVIAYQGVFMIGINITTEQCTFSTTF